MPALVPVLAVGVLLVLVLAWWLIRRRRGGALLEVDKFSTARTVTTRWAEDPSSAPAPVQPLMKPRQDD